MKNIKSISSDGCDTCVHDKVCMYKPLKEEAVKSLQVGEMDDTAPFEITIHCAYQTSVLITPKTTQRTIPTQAELEEYTVVDDIDRSSAIPNTMIQQDVFTNTPEREEPNIVERRLN